MPHPTSPAAASPATPAIPLHAMEAKPAGAETSERWAARISAALAAYRKDMDEEGLDTPREDTEFMAMVSALQAAEACAAADFERLAAAIEARGTALARAMPDEAAALRVLFAAYERLKALGFKDAVHCPKDGKARQFIEVGSSGIHVGHREDDGAVWLADAGDLWPSRPILFRELPVPVVPSTAAGDTP